MAGARTTRAHRSHEEVGRWKDLGSETGRAGARCWRPACWPQLSRSRWRPSRASRSWATCRPRRPRTTAGTSRAPIAARPSPRASGPSTSSRTPPGTAPRTSTPILNQFAEDGADFIVAQASGYNRGRADVRGGDRHPGHRLRRPRRDGAGPRRERRHRRRRGRLPRRRARRDDDRRPARSGIVISAERRRTGQAGRRLRRRAPGRSTRTSSSSRPTSPSSATPTLEGGNRVTAAGHRGRRRHRLRHGRRLVLRHAAGRRDRRPRGRRQGLVHRRHRRQDRASTSRSVLLSSVTVGLRADISRRPSRTSRRAPSARRATCWTSPTAASSCSRPPNIVGRGQGGGGDGRRPASRTARSRSPETATAEARSTR